MKKLSFFLWVFFLGAVFSEKGMALVDYSESTKENSLANSGHTDSHLLIGKSDFSLNTQYEMLEQFANNPNTKMGLIDINTHLQTPFNIYLDFNAKNINEEKKNNESSKWGNYKVLLGFNWLRVGNPTDEARLNLFSGVMLPSSSRSYAVASSRTDKIFGIETTKRFGPMGLGLGYDLTLAGSPKMESEMSLGNIHRINISAGVIVSPDIQFEIEVENYKINPSRETSRASSLKKEISYSVISSKLNLGISKFLSVDLGARFRMKKIQSEENLSSARFLEMHGVYSNSLFVGLNLNTAIW